ncbi:MAG: DegT/DnrJ/EryC1/StrS family aminotransferase [Anaeromyxobacteraceae bacterium]
MRRCSRTPPRRTARGARGGPSARSAGWGRSPSTATEIITTGEGGMLTTDDDDLAGRLRFLKDHGMSPERRYFHTELAFNYRLTNLQAALGLAQLEQLEEFVAKKRLIHQWYEEALRGVPGLALNGEAPGTRNVFWMTSAVLPPWLEPGEAAARLRARGVETRPFFVPMSALPHLAGFRRVSAGGEGRCPVAASLWARGLCLPSGCGLSREEVLVAAGALREALAQARPGAVAT